MSAKSGGADCPVAEKKSVSSDMEKRLSILSTAKVSCWRSSCMEGGAVWEEGAFASTGRSTIAV